MLDPQTLAQVVAAGNPASNSVSTDLSDDDAWNQYKASLQPKAAPSSNLFKDMVSAPATMLARPVQAAEDLGDYLGTKIEADRANTTAEKSAILQQDQQREQQKQTQASGPGGIVAPTPANGADLEKDVGRGIQTVAYGLSPAAGGAAFGAGSSLEQGNDLLSPETAVNTVLGLVGGKALELAGKPIINTAGKAIGAITPDLLKDIAARGSQAITDFAAQHEILPQAVSRAINTAADTVNAAAEKPFDAAADLGSAALSKAKEGVASVAQKAFGTPDEIATNELTKTINKYAGARSVLEDATKTNGTDPIGVLKDPQVFNAVTTLDNGRINSSEAQDLIESKIKNLSELKNDVAFYNENETPFEDFKQRALDTVDAQKGKGWTQARVDKVKQQVSNLMDDLAPTYNGKGLPTAELDKIKTEQTGLSKSYNNQGQSPFAYDAHGIIGKAARDLVELNTEDAPTQALNKLIQSHYDALDILDKLNGKTPNGGRMSKLLGRVGGEVAGAIAGSTVGHPFVGAMAGRVGADAVSDLLNTNVVSNPLKKAILSRLQSADPEVVAQAQKYLEGVMPNISDLGAPKPTPHQPLSPKEEAAISAAESSQRSPQK